MRDPLAFLWPYAEDPQPTFADATTVFTRARAFTTWDAERFTPREHWDMPVAKGGWSGAIMSLDGRSVWAESYESPPERHFIRRYDIEEAQCALPESALIHFVPFDGTGRDFVESAETLPAGQSTFRPGLVGRALALGADSGQMVLRSPSDTHFGEQPTTLAFYIKPEMEGGPVPLLEAPWSGRWRGWSLSVDEGLRIRLLVHPRKMPEVELQSTATLKPRVWNHVALVWDGAEYRIYLDGKASGLMKGPEEILNRLEPIRLGWTQGRKERFAGLLDEFALWGRALSGDEIRGIFERRLTGPCKP